MSLRATSACSFCCSGDKVAYRILIAKNPFICQREIHTGWKRLAETILSSLDKVHVTINNMSCQLPVLDWPVEVINSLWLAILALNLFNLDFQVQNRLYYRIVQHSCQQFVILVYLNLPQSLVSLMDLRV